MAKEYAKAFYNSARWKRTSRAYMASRHWLCERCGGVASICHHRQWLTPESIADPSVALSWENLECLCHQCHDAEHMSNPGVCVFDSQGQIIAVNDDAESFKDAQKAIDAILGR